jgi:hypothetical protein
MKWESPWVINEFAIDIPGWLSERSLPVNPTRMWRVRKAL